MSGKASDVYSPKYAFVLGSSALAALSLGTGFVNDKIGLIVLRALAGIAGSMTIPSALSMLVRIFPKPNEQARAISVFGGFAAMGNVLGLVIGALFVQYTLWRWIFWSVAIGATLAGSLIAILAPPISVKEAIGPRASKLRRLDLPGVSVLTTALILLIFGVTSSTASGWGSVTVLTPFTISIGVFIAFFFWEARLPTERAAIPSEIWFYPNFAVLFGVALYLILWWTAVFINFVTLWQDLYHWSIISTALHLLPIGGIALSLCFSSSLSKVINPRYLILFGHVLIIIATVVLAHAAAPEKYSSYTVPGFLIGSGGAQTIYMQTNIAIFRTAPPSMAGTVGAIFNSALQVGSAVGLAIVTSIQTSVDEKVDHSNSIKDMFKGRAASFWFLLGLAVLELLSVTIFYHCTPVPIREDMESTEVKGIENKKLEPAY